MKKIVGILMLCMIFSCISINVEAQERANPGRSVALILTVSGVDKVMDRVEIFKQDVFDGKAKNIYTMGSLHSKSALHVQVLNQSNEIIFEGYLDNPLDLQLESFNPDGSIERSSMVKEEGHVNLRFPLPEGNPDLVIKCYQYFSSESETLVSTINLSNYEN
ncbi:MAG: hypothetical protein EYC69_10675 [Bacteroidetes bacterium]|nr:MAG: hypothetical protein EYC69_10675 [Bacteroidota bacterium]